MSAAENINGPTGRNGTQWDAPMYLLLADHMVA